MKTRVFEDKNYKGIFVNNKTIRIALNPDKEIQELDFPEFYDVKITDKCFGKCNYCYMDSNSNDLHTPNIIERFNNIFKPMSKNQRPFSVACGGGETTLHPDFCDFIKSVDELGIIPNYTTNGMWVNEPYKDKVLEVTEKYCGGVAVSTHPHLKKYWHPAVNELLKLKNTEVNFHTIISDRESMDYFIDIFNEFKDRIDHYVLLPYIKNTGRSKEDKIDMEYFIEKIPNNDHFAFGAGFYNFLKSEKGNKYKVSLYDPEKLSKFIDLKTNTLYPSSFCLDKPLKVFDI